MHGYTEVWGWWCWKTTVMDATNMVSMMYDEKIPKHGSKLN